MTDSSEYRARVKALRGQYRQCFAEEIGRAASGPPLSPSQLAHLRRVFQARRGITQ